MNCDELQQLAALHALGALGGQDRERLEKRLKSDPDARADFARFVEAAAALAHGVQRREAPPGVRSRVLARIAQTPQHRAPGNASPESSLPEQPLPEGVTILRRDDGVWVPSPLPGGRFKLLSVNVPQDYAVIYVDLAPGTCFPEHDHAGSEDLYVLTGDLHSEGRRLGPGDFIHADTGSHHHELRTIEGCTALMVVPLKSLQTA
jgi:anti-sigma factor ChrR (cupin superfamily)